MSFPPRSHFTRDSRRLHGEEGVALVEFALVAPVIVIFILGVIDFGNVWRQDNVSQEAIMSSARVASSASKNRFADYEALRALSAGLSGLKSTTVTKVIIWKANSANTPPSGCMSITPSGTGTFGVSGSCNVYSSAQLTSTSTSGFPATSSSNPSCGAGSWDGNWCPTSRVNVEGSGDYIGVYVELEYTSLTGVIPGGKLTFSNQAIYRLEPPYVGG